MDLSEFVENYLPLIVEKFEAAEWLSVRDVAEQAALDAFLVATDESFAGAWTR